MKDQNGMTAKLGELARYGRKTPYDDTNSIPYRSWLVWQALRTRVSTVYHDERNDVAGHVFCGKLSTIVHNLFPEFTVGNVDERNEIVNAIRHYLRRSANARCLEWGRNTTPKWWVRDEWNDTQTIPQTVRFVEPYAQSRAERKLTRKEAGEDRPSSPVVVQSTAKQTEDEEEMKTVETLKTDSHDDDDDERELNVDPRWEQEFYDSVNRGTGSKRFASIARYVVERGESFFADEIAQKLDVQLTNVYTHLHTLQDMGLLSYTASAQKVASPGRWSTTIAQRATIERLLVGATVHDLTHRMRGSHTASPARDTILDAFIEGERLPIFEIAARTYMHRNRVKATLRRLVMEEKLSSEDDGDTVVWFKPATSVHTSEPSSVEPQNKTDDERSSASSPDSDTAMLAELLEEIVEERVNDRLKEASNDADEIRRQIAECRNERDHAIAERDELRRKLDGLRAMMD